MGLIYNYNWNNIDDIAYNLYSKRNPGPNTPKDHFILYKNLFYSKDYENALSILRRRKIEKIRNGIR